jgi:hypothetical protein
VVDAAYAAAIKAGGTDESEPADRTYFASGYYAANVADFDGNRLEFVHKAWNPHSNRNRRGALSIAPMACERSKRCRMYPVPKDVYYVI